MGLGKPVDRPDHDVDDPLYLMTLTIPQFFLKSLQVMWDATVFGVFNDNFHLYIIHMVVNVLASLLYNCGFCKSLYIIVLLPNLLF